MGISFHRIGSFYLLCRRSVLISNRNRIEEFLDGYYVVFLGQNSYNGNMYRKLGN